MEASTWKVPNVQVPPVVDKMLWWSVTLLAIGVVIMLGAILVAFIYQAAQEPITWGDVYRTSFPGNYGKA